VYILAEVTTAPDEAIVSNMIRVSNLDNNVTVLQLVEQFGMIGRITVSNVKLTWLKLLWKRMSYSANIYTFI